MNLLAIIRHKSEGANVYQGSNALEPSGKLANHLASRKVVAGDLKVDHKHASKSDFIAATL
jgi:hypothetical protein